MRGLLLASVPLFAVATPTIRATYTNDGLAQSLTLHAILFKDSVMVAVATAGAPTASVGASGKCERTEGEAMPMLMMIPRLSAYLFPLEGAYSPPLPTPPGAGRDPRVGGLLWRLSGADGEFAMIGLGDIVLPALALAFGRRIDLASSAARGEPAPRFGYFGWTVAGYAIGLAVTLCANAYGWTFNGVEGQPALLYLVPGVVGSQLVRSALRGELSDVWEGSPLPQPPANMSPIVCDGCRAALLLDETVYSDTAKNVDFCASCYGRLQEEKKAPLAELSVYSRCGIEPPAEFVGGRRLLL